MGVRSNGRGKYVVQVWDAAEGKNRHVGSFLTKREADLAFQKAKGTRSSRITVAEFAASWTRDYPRPAASTNKHNAERVKAFAKQYGKRRLDQVDRRTARAWVLEHPNELSSLRAMFSDAVIDDLIDANPFKQLGTRQKRARRDLQPDWLLEDDIQELAATALLVHNRVTGQLAKCMILVAAYTGIRPGELFALEVGDVRDGELVISKAMQSSTKTIGPPKNGKPRVIVLPEVAQAAIHERPRLHDRILFPSPTGRQLYQSSWYGIWNPIRNAAGRPDMHFYELRHWMATHLLEQGLTPSDVAVQLGHTDGGVLVQTLYGHPSESRARERIRRALDDEAAA
jgi:integrase